MNPSSFVNLYIFPVGRRLHVHSLVHERAQAMGLTRIAAQAERAIAHDRQTHLMELTLMATPSSLFGQDAVDRNRAMDKLLSGFERYLALQVQVYGVETPAGRAAHEIRALIFPSGVRAITHLPYVQQYEQVEGLLARLAEPDLQEAVRELTGADAMIRRIAAQNAEFGASLVQQQPGVSREAVRAANARGQDLLARTVILILAEFIDNESDARFRQLMEPVLEQNEAIGELRRRRRNRSARRQSSAGQAPEQAPPEKNA